MTRVMLRLALLALLLTPRAATAQDPRQNTPGQFDFYVLSLPSEAPAMPMCNAGRDRILSSFMGCGRNMTTAFQNIAKFRRRGLIAAWSPPWRGQIKNKISSLFTAVPPCSGTMGIVTVETASGLETIAFGA